MKNNLPTPAGITVSPTTEKLIFVRVTDKHNGSVPIVHHSPMVFLEINVHSIRHLTHVKKNTFIHVLWRTVLQQSIRMGYIWITMGYILYSGAVEVY